MRTRRAEQVVKQKAVVGLEMRQAACLRGMMLETEPKGKGGLDSSETALSEHLRSKSFPLGHQHAGGQWISHYINLGRNHGQSFTFGPLIPQSQNVFLSVKNAM